MIERQVKILDKTFLIFGKTDKDIDKKVKELEEVYGNIDNEGNDEPSDS
jgi:hypothetical protein